MLYSGRGLEYRAALLGSLLLSAMAIPACKVMLLKKKTKHLNIFNTNYAVKPVLNIDPSRFPLRLFKSD